MRTPERCPWCGAEMTGDVSNGTFRHIGFGCGAVLRCFSGGPVLWWSLECQNKDTPSAVAYRQTLAWRKRLSQHTGVPVRLVPEPIRTHHSPTWRGGIWLESLGGRWRLQCWHQADIGQMRLPIRERARRRLLAMAATVTHPAEEVPDANS